jgi:hypothetical protein
LIHVFSIENLKAFVDQVLAGKAEAYMKSEPVPETQGNVKVLVSRNFNEIIEESDQDALVEFYAPWFVFIYFYIWFTVYLRFSGVDIARSWYAVLVLLIPFHYCNIYSGWERMVRNRNLHILV